MKTIIQKVVFAVLAAVAWNEASYAYIVKTTMLKNAKTGQTIHYVQDNGLAKTDLEYPDVLSNLGKTPNTAILIANPFSTYTGVNDQISANFKAIKNNTSPNIQYNHSIWFNITKTKNVDVRALETRHDLIFANSPTLTTDKKTIIHHFGFLCKSLKKLHTNYCTQKDNQKDENCTTFFTKILEKIAQSENCKKALTCKGDFSKMGNQIIKKLNLENATTEQLIAGYTTFKKGLMDETLGFTDIQLFLELNEVRAAGSKNIVLYTYVRPDNIIENQLATMGFVDPSSVVTTPAPQPVPEVKTKKEIDAEIPNLIVESPCLIQASATTDRELFFASAKIHTENEEPCTLDSVRLLHSIGLIKPAPINSTTTQKSATFLTKKFWAWAGVGILATATLITIIAWIKNRFS